MTLICESIFWSYNLMIIKGIVVIYNTTSFVSRYETISV